MFANPVALHPKRRTYILICDVWERLRITSLGWDFIYHPCNPKAAACHMFTCRLDLKLVAKRSSYLTLQLQISSVVAECACILPGAPRPWTLNSCSLSVVRVYISPVIRSFPMLATRMKLVRSCETALGSLDNPE